MDNLFKRSFGNKLRQTFLSGSSPKIVRPSSVSPSRSPPAPWSPSSLPTTPALSSASTPLSLSAPSPSSPPVSSKPALSSSSPAMLTPSQPPSSLIRISTDIVAALEKQHAELPMLFKVFLQEQLDGHYNEFWVDMDNFQRTYARKNHIEVTLAAQALFDRYFSADTSLCTLPVKQRMVDAVHWQIQAGECPCNTFDEVVAAVERDAYKKFTRSNLYASFLADRGSFVRTASPKRRVSITELFKKREERRSSLGLGASSFGAAMQEEQDEDDVHDYLGLNPHRIDLSQSIGDMPTGGGNGSS